MADFPALNVSFWFVFLYFACSLFPIYFSIFSPPKSRLGYLLLGSYILFFASFILTTTSEAVLIATEMLNKNTGGLTDEMQAALKEFRKNIMFLGNLVTFLVGGVGVGVVTKIIPSIGYDKRGMEVLQLEILNLKKERIYFKVSLLFMFLLVAGSWSLT